MLEPKIPKIIHYCWFSGEPFSPFIKSCIDTWKEKLPDYEFVLWDANSFDFDSVPFVKEAFRKKKWAFVADYIRLYAVYNYGGIYLDSDVKVFKSFDPYLKYSFFTSHEYHPGNFTYTEKEKLNSSGVNLSGEYVYGLNIQAAIFGGVKGNTFLKECLDFYDNFYSIENINGKELNSLIIGPFISKIAESYGYRYNLERQKLNDDMIIFEPEVFVGNSQFLNKNSVAIHLINGSWNERSSYQKFLNYHRNYNPNFFKFILFFDKVIRKMKNIFKN